MQVISLLVKQMKSWFFHVLMEVYVVRNRVQRLCKSMLMKTYSAKEFSLKPSIEYERVDISLDYTWPEKEFIQPRNLKTKANYIKISKTLFYSYPKPRSVKTPPQSSFFVPLWKISSLFWKIQSSKSFVVDFGRFIKLCAHELYQTLCSRASWKKKFSSPNYELFFKSFTLDYFKKVKRSIDQKNQKDRMLMFQRLISIPTENKNCHELSSFFSRG